MTGVVIIVGVNALCGLGRDTLAQLAILGGALLYGFAAIYGKRFKDYAPVVTATGTMIWATLVLYPLALLIDQPWSVRITPASAGAAVALAVLSTAGALLIYFRLVKTIGSMGVASQSYLRSMVAIAVGVLFLNEPVSLNLIAGAGLIVAGMILINGPATVRQ